MLKVLLTIVLMLVVVTACSDEPSPTPTPEPTPTNTPTPTPEPTPTATPTPTPTTVAVAPATVELAALGSTLQLSAEVRDQDSTVMTGVTVTWSSSANSAAAGPVSGVAVMTVAQAVSSVEVAPSMTELTAWGETVRLTAEAYDANGHEVAGAAFSWESADVRVAAVDSLGVASGVGEGMATITASAGAASGSAVVTVPPTFTLSGTVRDSRENGPSLAGAVVRLENGKRESVVIGRDGRYRFPNVWGTVTVRAIAGPTHGNETVDITMDQDRTLDFALEHTGAPYRNTRFPRVIEPSDPTKLESITYRGRGERSVWDRRLPAWITIDAYLFDARYAGQVVEFRVNPEFGSKEAAQAEVETHAPMLGQIPAVLLSAIRYVDINGGQAPWSSSLDSRAIHILTDWNRDYKEEIFVHEAAHIALDPAHRDSAGWRAAQKADGVFISEYARDQPDVEDVAESFRAYLAVRYRADRLTAAEAAVILRTIPNRLKYFDEQGFDMSPYEPSEVQEPTAEIVTIQGTVIGPDNQPLEGVVLWAWAGRREDSGRASTGEDGAFAIMVPDGSFTLDVYAPGEGCTAIGWYGPGGFTNVKEDAIRIEVDGESVMDIVIRLPGHPDALPRVGHCA